MKFHRQKKVRSFLSIAPLIDCVFLLLIFFLLTSSFIEQGSIRIDLPESAYTSEKEHRDVTITLSSEGDIVINTTPTNLTGLTADLEQFIQEEPVDSAVIRADREVQLHMLVTIMDRTRSAGINNVNIQTIPVTHDNDGPSNE